MPAGPLSPSHAIEDLYAENHLWLQKWLRSKLGCVHHAADLAQDTFVRILSKSEVIPIREPRSYLATIANGLVYDFRRRQRLEQRYLEALQQLPEPLQPSPETRALQLEALSALDALLDQLPSAVRRAFLLSQLSGWTHERIATELQISVSTVKRHIVRGLTQCCLLP
ncbi:sigma-70 family RNA polymerase sigma factor [Bordetella petrii]|uniref:sigma-70 family RNA polymerase sigma factor n=1 Tax=Bordetella petrii TaxID=94624 RepID=UPI001E58BBD1|nr:sigma-70 family RNA polymerase sigma factor [Bordetella petrii]MCD0501597.1 sigma-70 family RNA polymerase sigma factor [Bordetella petrii]